MPVDAFASYPHYLDHIRPIWDALEDKGTLTTRGGLGPGDPVIVAGYPDIRRTRHRQHILVEHGAGESWDGIDGHYSGGVGRESVILFVCPNQLVADRNLDRYPKARAVIGSPRLESLALSLTGKRQRREVRDGHLRVVVSFHWDNRTWPETRSTMNLYSQHISEWEADERIELAGHAHPRIAGRAKSRFSRFIDDFAEVVEWADVYAVDNSSTLFEAAALGLDVVLLNAPWHPTESKSFRFWQHAGIGPHVNAPDEFVDAVIHAKSHRSDYDDARDAMAREIFPALDGSTRRVVAAIESVTNDKLRSQGQMDSAHFRTIDPQPSQLGISGTPGG